ncbi:MAG TPA: hypothetical protein VKP13_12360 [Nitrospira sp.]|nr:hypothetical protein [Nitrospira sp.]
MKERAAASGRLRSFGSVISPETVAKYLTEDEGNCVIDARTMLADFFNRLLEEPEGEQMWDYVLLVFC